MARSCIRGNSFSLFFSVSFLESFSSGRSQPSGRITAAAYTGPISGPAPASSTPHTAAKPSAAACRSYVHRSAVSLIFRSPPPSPV